MGLTIDSMQQQAN